MIKVMFLFLIMSSFCIAQNESDVYFKKKVSKIENDFQEVLNNHSYIIYSTPYTMHMILEKENDYYHFAFHSEYDDNFKIKDIKIIKDKKIKKIFNKNNYEKGIVDIKSEFYKKYPLENIVGLPTYFSYNTNFQQRYCEYFLAVGINPTPMNLETYKFLSSILLENTALRW